MQSGLAMASESVSQNIQSSPSSSVFNSAIPSINRAAPPVFIETNEPRTRIDVEFLRDAVSSQKPPATGKIDQSAIAHTDLYRNEIADVLMNVLLNSIAPVDSGAYFAEYFVPR